MASKSKRAALAQAQSQLQALNTESFFLKAWPWLSGAWAAWILVLYFQRFPFSAVVLGTLEPSALLIKGSLLVQDALILLELLAVVFAAYGLGFGLLSRLSINWHSPLERAVFSLGLGFGLLAYAILAMGVLQWYSTRNIWIFLAAAIGLILWLIKSRGLSQNMNDVLIQLHTLPKDQLGWPLHKCLLVIFLLIPFCMGFVPEVFYDSMVYHLGVPNWYLQQGGIRYYPALHAHFPFTRQMLNLLGLALQNGESLPKLIHWFSAPLIVMTYLAMAIRHSTLKGALIASLAFFSMPMVNINLWNTGVDVGMASFALLSSYAWLNALTDKERALPWTILAGVFAGLTFGSKYPGFLCVFCMLVTSALWMYWKERSVGAALRSPLLIGFVAFLVVLPWLIKSYVLTGNPFYPYLFKYFGGRDLVVEQTIHWMNETKSGGSANLLDLVKAPWLATFANVSSLSAPGLFPLCFLGFCFWGIFKKDVRDSWYLPLAMFSFLYMAIINWMTNQLRLGIPGFVTLCFVLGHAAALAAQKRGPLFRFVLSALVLGCAVVGFDGSWGILVQCYHPLDVIRGKETRLDYLSYTHPGLNPYPSTLIFDYAKNTLPPGSRLLIVGDEKVSNCHMPFIATGVYNQPYIVQWAKSAKTPEDIYRSFLDAKITHMTINPMEGIRLGHPYNWFNWDPDSLVRFCEFWDKHVRVIHQEMAKEKYFPGQNALWLCAILPEKDAAQIPLAPNILLEIHEQAKFPGSEPGWAEGRSAILAELRKRSPNNAGIQERVRYLQTITRGT